MFASYVRAGHSMSSRRRKHSDRFFGIFIFTKKREKNALEDQLIIKLTFPCKTHKQSKEKKHTHTLLQLVTHIHIVPLNRRKQKGVQREKYI